MRKLRVEVYRCPNCHSEVEIFSDETRVRCQKCGTMVFKERLPTCIEWCASARQCLGEERWKEIMGDLPERRERPAKPELTRKLEQKRKES